MSVVGDVVGDVVGGITGTKAAGEAAAGSSLAAANIAAQSQREALDFYKEATAPQREAQALAMPLYTEAVLDPTAALTKATESPLYQAQLQAAEESALRGMSATGGLRSGAAVSGLADVGQRAQMNAYNQYMSGLANLSGLDTGATNVANMMSGIGQTQAQGIAAAGQAQQAAAGQQAGILGAGLGALGMFAMSDIALKDDVSFFDNTPVPGINRYFWKWNDKASDIGLSGEDSGFIAQEVEKVWPELVATHESGYKMINKREIENRLEALNG